MNDHSSLPAVANAARPARRPARGWALTAVAAVLVFVLYLMRYEILPFVIAGSIGFVADPLLRRLQPYVGDRRWIPATLLFILILLAGSAATYWIGSVIAGDVSQLASKGPKMVHDLAQQLVGQNGISLFGQTYTADKLTQDIQTKAGTIVGPSGYAAMFGIGIGAILGIFLTLVLIPYFLIAGPSLVKGMIWLVPPERRPAIERTLPRIVPALRRYVVGMIIVVSLTAIAAYLGYGLVFALPHAILISIAVGFLEVIPALGPFASLVLVGLSSMQEHGIGAAAGLMGYAIALRLGIDNVLGPFVLGRSARLHPVAIIFAFIAGSTLFGLVGLLLAVPVATCLIIVLDQYYDDRLAEEPAR